MEAPPTRYVLCGVSSRAIELYIPAFTDGFLASHGELVGILDVDRGRAETFSRLRGLDLPIYEPHQFDAMLADTKPEAVIVATPDGTHAEYIVQALEHDLDVITEKPLVSDTHQAAQVLRAEHTSRGSIRVTHNVRYDPAHLRIKQMIRDGLLGRITNVELVWNVDTIHGSSYFYRWNRDRAKSGGLSIAKGCHHFDVLNWWLADRPEQVFAYGALNYYGAGSPHNPSVVDDKEYTPEEQRDLCPYHRHRRKTRGLFAGDDHLPPQGPASSIPYNVQYPPEQPIYIYDHEIDIEDTYSAVIRYRGGATVSYSSNYSAPWEGYVLAINGTHGRLETTRSPPTAADGQQIIYYPLFGERQMHDIRTVKGGHGGADPVLLRDVFVGPTDETAKLGAIATSTDGAYAVAVGEAVWRSVVEKRPIDIADLLPADLEEISDGGEGQSR